MFVCFIVTVFSMTVFAISFVEPSIVKTELRPNSSILFARKITVSKLASDSAEQPEKAA